MQVINSKIKYLFTENGTSDVSANLIWAKLSSNAQSFNPETVFTSSYKLRGLISASEERLANTQAVSWEEYVKNLAKLQVSLASPLSQRAELADYYRFVSTCYGIADAKDLLSTKVADFFTANSSLVPLQFQYICVDAPQYNQFMMVQLEQNWEWIIKTVKRVKTIFKTALNWIDQFAELFYIARIPQILLA